MNTNPTTMRKFLTTLGTLAALLVNAQNSAVVSAYMAMEDGKLAEAAGYIEPAILNEGTMVKEKTWRYRGQIYQRIAMSDDAALKAQFPDALDKSISSYQKANELDTKGAEKAENNKQLRMMQAVALNAGNDAFTAKDYDKAVLYYGKSEAIAKGFGEVDSNAVFNSALAYESKGDQAMALERYKECLRIGYDKPDIFRYTASLQKRAGDLEGAIATTKDGLKRHANHKELMLDLIAFLQEAGRVDEVESMVGKALEQDPGNAVLYSLRASIFEGKADPKSGAKPSEADMAKWYDMAEMDYKKSIELDPKFFDSYFNIGVLYNNRAAYEYEKANEIKEDAPYAKAKKKADDVYIKSLPYFEKALELRPDDKPTREQLIRLYAKTGNTAKFNALKSGTIVSPSAGGSSTATTSTTATTSPAGEFDFSGSIVAPPTRVVVANVEGTACTGSDLDLTGLTDILSLRISKHYEVMEREKLEAALKESKLGMTGLVDEQTATEGGKLVGAEAIVLCRRTCLNQKEFYSIKLISCKTGQQLWAASGYGMSFSDALGRLEQKLPVK